MLPLCPSDVLSLGCRLGILPRATGSCADSSLNLLNPEDTPFPTTTGNKSVWGAPASLKNFMVVHFFRSEITGRTAATRMGWGKGLLRDGSPHLYPNRGASGAHRTAQPE